LEISITGGFLLVSLRDSWNRVGIDGVMGRNDAKLDQIGGSTDSISWTANFLIEEENYDKRLLWRLGSWAVASVIAIASAMLVMHTSNGLRRDRVAFVEMTRQAQQLQLTARDSQDEARRLSAAVDTLNSDRDRLYARVSAVEQNINSVTGSIGKQSSSWPTAPTAPVATTPPVVSNLTANIATPPDTISIPAAKPDILKESIQKDQAAKKDQLPKDVSLASQLPSIPAKPQEPQIQAKPDSKIEPLIGAKPSEAATAPPLPDPPTVVAALPKEAPATPPIASPASTVQRTDFGVDLGSANSVEGLRALWRGSIKGWPALVGSLQPLIVVKEGEDGLGLRLHLVAGPLNDAAAAAKLCANLVASRHGCETAVFDGQRLALDAPASMSPVPPRDRSRRKSRGRAEKPVEEPQRPAQTSSSGFSIFGSR
jgi:hypothetical protein